MPSPVPTSHNAAAGSTARRVMLPGLYGFVAAMAALLLWRVMHWPYAMEALYASFFVTSTGVAMASAGTPVSKWTRPIILCGAVIAGVLIGRVASLLLSS